MAVALTIPATVGNSLDITGDGTEDGAVARKFSADTVRQLDFARHQGQVSHRGRQVQLEPGFDSEVAGLADPQLNQSRQSVFHHHASRSILVKGGAPLQRPACCNMGMQSAPAVPYPPLPPMHRGRSGHTPTYRRVELGRPRKR